MTDQPFSTEQQEYLKGFMAGVEAKNGPLTGGSGASPDPTDLQRAAQDRTLASGGKLVPEEDAKRKKNPLDRFGEISALAGENKFPKGTDVFLTKYHGLFFVAPAQNSFMCRLRMPGGILNTLQFRGLADMAEEMGGGYTDVTTRANLQIREIAANFAPEILTRLADLGLTSRGSGADNVRNVTGSPTAGIDPQELIDTRADARRIHHHILNHRELYGLPRKFNIAFDGCGVVPVLEDTNDVAFTAVQVQDGFGVPGGVYYTLALGGITGHKDFARNTGIVVAPGDTTPVCDAILRVFIANGDRTNRLKARLKYVLDDWGFDKFLAAVEEETGRPFTRLPPEALLPTPAQSRSAHIGVHPQRQFGLSYVGVVVPVGRITVERMRGLADIADRFGSGTIRLTVWQNLLISDIPNQSIPEALAAIEALGLGHSAGPLRTGLVACTGNAGCKFAASNTKGHAAGLVEWLEERIEVDAPINIHLTGCHNSCAQHYIADIGLLGAKVERGEDMVEGYDLHVGGGAGPNQAIGRLIRPAVAAEDVPPLVLALLETWKTERTPDQSFQAWSATKSDDALTALVGTAA
ncbi:NirA family protein [Acidisphaera sp. L21]|uniref:NirA family protein n=1 Tax=Acidisphaera sp. L21 TaxID=1641851 RepID=UPI00131D04FB|nr:NirA family protein [Acidisphaera sp. L21]